MTDPAAPRTALVDNTTLTRLYGLVSGEVEAEYESVYGENLNAAVQRELAAPADSDAALRATVEDKDLQYALRWYFDGRPQSERGVKAYKRLLKLLEPAALSRSGETP